MKIIKNIENKKIVENLWKQREKNNKNNEGYQKNIETHWETHGNTE